MRTNRLPVLLLGLAVAGCAATPGPAPSSPLSPTAAPSPTPTADPAPPVVPSSSAAAFTLAVLPPEEPAASRVAIPGSGYCFLIVVEDGSPSPGAVTIEASATGAAVTEIRPAQLEPGTVGEVWVVADPSTVEATGSVTITGTRGDVTRTETRSLPVFPMEDARPEARGYFDRWVSWLESEHPELGITATTDWQPVFVSTLLVVSHYSYWSEDWEATIAWHNMIAPYDWTEIHLRRRWVDAAPSLAFKVDSVIGDTVPYAVAPPEVVVR
jgi:hypothetical protein